MKRNLITKNQQLEIGNSSAPHSSRPSLQSLWTLGFALSVLPLLARAERVYGNLPQLTEQTGMAESSSLSIIVPARNEENNLRRLLPSLECQNYPGEMEIVVVDDHSSDDTADVVTCEVRDTRCATKLLCAGPLPAGWLGKPHASHTGAKAARGKWLLFTDADTVHEPFSAVSSVTFAEAHGLDGLSIFPRQETRGFLDGAVLMVAFAGLFAGLRRSTKMLNGQYVLVRRDVYEASGGFAAVRSEMMDDLAYGNLLAEQGYKVPDDFSVVGFDNLDVSEFTYPPLTTVTQQVEQMMPRATEVLFEQIEGKLEVGPFEELLEPQLIVRQSTRTV